MALRYLKAYTKKLNYNGEIAEFTINDSIENIVRDIVTRKPDVVAFSTYIWNVDYVKRISTTLKEINSHIEILYGGPEVSYDGHNFLKESCGEYLIEGEGEETLYNFIQCKLNEKPLENIKGLYIKHRDGNISYGGKRPLMDMNSLVFPYEKDEDLNNKIVYYEGSRGCPFNCKYCLSSTIHGVRFLELDRVKKELKFLIDKGVSLVKFVDRTFNCNSKFAMSIWDFLIREGGDTSFHFEISADILKPEEIELLAKAPKGKFQFEVGVQTTNDRVLRNINRFVNFRDIKEKVIELEKLQNIKQHLDLIAGLPGENFQSFRTSFDDVYSIGPEEIQLGFLKLLKGSSMREESEKWGMKYCLYPPYEILETNDIKYEEIIILKDIEKMVDKYYNSQKFKNIIKFFMTKYVSAFDFFYDLGQYFYRKGYFYINLSNNEYYKVFLDFNKEILKGEDEPLKSIIRYDYLTFNKKRGIPDFIKGPITKQNERIIKDKLREDNCPIENSWVIDEFSIDVQEFERTKVIKEEKNYILFKNCEKIRLNYEI